MLELHLVPCRPNDLPPKCKCPVMYKQQKMHLKRKEHAKWPMLTSLFQPITGEYALTSMDSNQYERTSVLTYNSVFPHQYRFPSVWIHDTVSLHQLTSYQFMDSQWDQKSIGFKKNDASMVIRQQMLELHLWYCQFLAGLMTCPLNANAQWCISSKTCTWRGRSMLRCQCWHMDGWIDIWTDAYSIP